MSMTFSAGELLREAADFFDAQKQPLREQARAAWRGGFVSGGNWMQSALAAIRREPATAVAVDFSRLGLVKYGCATSAALLVAAAALWSGKLWMLLATIPVFYAIEAQMLFLFPLAIDGSEAEFRTSREWTLRAGGTWRVMCVVLPIALSMVLGGLAGRGFVRSWCVGCVAVLLWYERLRTVQQTQPLRSRLEIAARGELQVRRERVTGFNNPVPLRVLLASDLHCRGTSSRRAGEQLVRAATTARPDVILLGGDLADTRNALPQLTQLVTKLSALAPVWAIAGNHDTYVGTERVRTAVEAGDGHWLGERSVRLEFSGNNPLSLDGAISSAPTPGQPRILCAHNPRVFPQAAAMGYQLTLAGHLHGGQCVLGTHAGRLYPGAWFFRWNGPRFEVGDTTLLVSTGVHDTLPLRWNCPREIILCELC